MKKGQRNCLTSPDRQRRIVKRTSPDRQRRNYKNPQRTSTKRPQKYRHVSSANTSNKHAPRTSAHRLRNGQAPRKSRPNCARHSHHLNLGPTQPKLRPEKVSNAAFGTRKEQVQKATRSSQHRRRTSQTPPKARPSPAKTAPPNKSNAAFGTLKEQAKTTPALQRLCWDALPLAPRGRRIYLPGPVKSLMLE